MATTLLCMVRGYSIGAGQLRIHRPLWDTIIPLKELSAVDSDQSILRRSYRILGNGGAFSFTGLYRNDILGNFRVFANSAQGTLLLHFPKRRIVLATDTPEEMARALRAEIS